MQDQGGEVVLVAIPPLLQPSLPWTSPARVPLPGGIQASRSGDILAPKAINGVTQLDLCLSSESLPRREGWVSVRTTGRANRALSLPADSSLALGASAGAAMRGSQRRVVRRVLQLRVALSLS